ncbi:MAG: methionyl-tRNA formyltransferase [Rhodospirillaceae bacterium]|nr:methionyl-tRNA formyltransferase [Rhodospirillaceae bacterium]
MRIVVNGQQAFGKACLDAIIEKGVDDVVAVYTAPDVEGKPFDPIKQSALEAGLEVRQPDNFSDKEVLAELGSWDADLMILAYVIIFVPESARNITKHGTICFHPSLLPLHRGPSSINWPIIWGANKTGLTIFWPNDGLDEGEILLQKEVKIEPNDTLGSLYFDKIFPLGVGSTLEAIELIREGNAPRIKQDEARATYESWCRKENAEIDWERSAQEVYNLIRGCDPQPGAWTTLEGEVLQIFDAALTNGTGRVGRVSAIDDNSFTITAGLGGIRVNRVRYGKVGKISAADFMRDSKIVLGSRFGT